MTEFREQDLTGIRSRAARSNGDDAVQPAPGPVTTTGRPPNSHEAAVYGWSGGQPAGGGCCAFPTGPDTPTDSFRS